MPRNEEDILKLVTTLESGLDRAAREERRAGTRPFQRVNRAEYARLVNDLLGLTVDPGDWLLEDQISAGFDNIADVQGITPTLMISYLTAASEIARRAIGNEGAAALQKTYSNPPSRRVHQRRTYRAGEIRRRYRLPGAQGFSGADAADFHPRRRTQACCGDG
jgi:hypothetical protein